MKSILFSISFAVISFSGFSQDWQNVSSNDSLTIFAKEIHYQKTSDDIDHQRIVFKYKNNTNKPIEISFQRDLFYNGEKHPQDKEFFLNIPANDVMQYKEERNRDKTFYIFKKDNNGWIKKKLSNYYITHLKVR